MGPRNIFHHGEAVLIQMFTSGLIIGFQSALIVPDKRTDRAVVGPLRSIGEITGGKLPHLAVIVQALAAGALARTAAVGTVAHGHILLVVLTVHQKVSSK